MILGLLLLIQAPPGPAPSIDELLSQCSAESLEIRTRAQEALEARWRCWSDADLARLENAFESENAELSARAAAALDWIGTRRRFADVPDAIWRSRPDLAGLLQGGASQPIGRLLEDFREKVEAQQLGGKAILPILFALFEDERDSGIETGFCDMDEARTYTVSRLAAQLAREIAPGLANLDREGCASWWAHNKDRTEREWLVDGLSHEDPFIRSLAICGLAATRDASLLPRLFDVLLGIEDESSFAPAAKGLASFPPALLIPRYRKAILEGSLEVRMAAVVAVAAIEDPAVDAVLLEAFNVPDEDFHGNRGDIVMIAHPRVCDMAAILLARRLDLDLEDYSWPESHADRDRNLEKIRNCWRKGHDLPPIPFDGPGIVPLPRSAVMELLPGLSGEETGPRAAALARLSALGPGAWKPLQQEIAAADEPARERLVLAAREWMSLLQSVETGGAPWKPAATLRDQVHRPFDVDAFLKDVMEAWFDDPAIQELEFAVTRDLCGRGVTVSLKVGAAADAGGPFEGLEHSWPHDQRYELRWDRALFVEAMKADFAELAEGLREGADRPIQISVRLKKLR